MDARGHEVRSSDACSLGDRLDSHGRDKLSEFHLKKDWKKSL